jgi:hypothetical protein
LGLSCTIAGIIAQGLQHRSRIKKYREGKVQDNQVTVQQLLAKIGQLSIQVDLLEGQNKELRELVGELQKETQQEKKAK